MKQDVVLIAGPTASGKSALAIRLARDLGGIIINADSMQVYDGLRLITARPSAEEEAQAPHFLYGHIAPDQAYSVGHWLAEVKQLMSRDDVAQRPAIFVGGTGLYFTALLGGLAPIPEPDAEIRARLREQLLADGPEHLWHQLNSVDHEGAAMLRPNDGQRLVRALEVLHSTGKTLRHWQAHKGVPLVAPAPHRHIWLNPDRALLRERIRARFETMVAEGAVDEVKAFLAMSLPPDLPVMKAIGVPEIAQFLSGEAEINAIIEKSIIASAQYAKRQRTWFRGQFAQPWREYDNNYSALLRD